MALTPTSVYFFKWRPFWGRVKIKKELARLPREGLKVRISKGKATATTFALVSEDASMRTAFAMATLKMAKAEAKVAELAPRPRIWVWRPGPICFSERAVRLTGCPRAAD